MPLRGKSNQPRYQLRVVQFAANVTCELYVRRWTPAQDAALARELHALPDVCELLPRAEVHRRQELLRAAVSPLRSWMSIYLKVSRDAPYGLDLGHVLRTKLGKSCRQHIKSSSKCKPSMKKRGASVHCTGDAAACTDMLMAQGNCSSPLILEPSEDDALHSPRVLKLCSSDVAEMCLWN